MKAGALASTEFVGMHFGEGIINNVMQKWLTRNERLNYGRSLNIQKYDLTANLTIVKTKSKDCFVDQEICRAANFFVKSSSIRYESE